ncbi:MAG: hypothetical protein FWH55_13510, partial [Oscillospiraceae bacterium]|nr:hypothetical protein [Oscillospiraceae bacterium]
MGCYFNGAGNTVTTVVNNTDASAPAARTSRPTAVSMGKGIALDWSDNIVISGIDLFHLGHFALITGAVDNMLLENMVVDSLRDCFDIENVRNVTIRNCVMNSLQDDGLVMKATMTTGSMEHAVKNILIYNTIVAGYDMGSMLAGHPTESRPVAADQDGPTARIKLGTEGTAGYDQVTAFNVLLSRSRGVSLEQVDTNVLTNFVGYRMRMDDITSSPIYIKAGDRARYPLTGKGTSENMTPTNNERLTNTFQQHGAPQSHTLPGGTQALLDKYGIYPARRYYPVYGTTSATVPATTASGGSTTYGI